MGGLARRVYSVFKVRIGVAIMFAGLAGIAVSPGAAPAAWQIAVLALATLVSAGCAGAFNQLVERNYDGLMERTRNRPFVTGEFTAGPIWYVGLALGLAAAVAATALALNGWVALYVFLGAFVYGIVYTLWLKRRTPMNIVIGGLAGSFAVLAGAAAVDPGLSPASITLAIALFLWTPPHFWSLAAALRDEYAEASVPILPNLVSPQIAANVILINAALLVSASIAPTFFGVGWLYGAGAVLGGGYFLYRSVQYVLDPTPKKAMVNFFASLIQLGLLVLGALLGSATGL